LINPVLNLIPLSSLAAILLVTGYKLAKWSIFKEMYAKGWNQFIPFVLTILAIVFTDLLIGIIIGLAISIFFLLKANFKHSFKLNKEKLHIGETIRIELAQEVSFLNKASLKETLWSLPKDSNVIIDAAYSEYIDNDVLELIKDFKETVSVEKNIKLNIIGLQEKYELEDHIQFVNVMDKEKRLLITPQEILEILKQGNERFVKGRGTEKYFKHQINPTFFNQNPMVVVVSCIDSRTSPDLIFDVSVGDLLSIRIAGNIISKEIIGSIELSCKKLGAKVIVVMGHSNCGAVASAIHSIKEGHISSITNKIEKAIAQCNCDRETITSDPSIFNGVIKNNVKNSIEEIIQESEYLSQKINAHEISIIAAFYNTETGIVTFEQQYT
jgi:carbonic anhydrase